MVTEHEHRWTANFYEPGLQNQADYKTLIPVKCIGCGRIAVAVVLP